MSSPSANDGSYTLTVTFEVGTDLDIAQVLVQNRVAIAEPLLPEEVQRQGVTIKKQSPNIILVVVADLARRRATTASTCRNYATLRLRDELAPRRRRRRRDVFGAGNYSMRVWLDPQKLEPRSLTTAGRGRRDPRAERAGRGRPARPAAGRRTAQDVPVHRRPRSAG